MEGEIQSTYTTPGHQARPGEGGRTVAHGEQNTNVFQRPLELLLAASMSPPYHEPELTDPHGSAIPLTGPLPGTPGSSLWVIQVSAYTPLVTSQSQEGLLIPDHWAPPKVPGLAGLGIAFLTGLGGCEAAGSYGL